MQPVGFQQMFTGLKHMLCLIFLFKGRVPAIIISFSLGQSALFRWAKSSFTYLFLPWFSRQLLRDIADSFFQLDLLSHFNPTVEMQFLDRPINLRFGQVACAKYLHPWSPISLASCYLQITEHQIDHVGPVRFLQIATTLISNIIVFLVLIRHTQIENLQVPRSCMDSIQSLIAD